MGNSFVLQCIHSDIPWAAFTVGIEVTHKTHGLSLTFPSTKGLVEPQL